MLEWCIYYLKRHRGRVVYVLLKKAPWSSGVYMTKRGAVVEWCIYDLKEASWSSGVCIT